jgi:AAA domain
MAEHTNNKALITHIYPKMPPIGVRDEENKFIPEFTQQPISDEREGDVWHELRELTFDDAPGSIFVALHETDRGYSLFERKFAKEETEAGRLRLLPNLILKREITKEGKPISNKELIPWNLGIRQCADEVIKRCSFRRGDDLEPMLALVLWQPHYWHTHRGVDYLKYLSKVTKACPDLPIYIFHDYHTDKYGVEREGGAGSGSWQSRFHSKTEALTIPEDVAVVVRGLCNVGSVSMWGALPKHGKSYLFLSLMKALLAGKPWLGHFEVSKSQRVVYLVPEVGLRGVMKRLRKLGMVDYLFDSVRNPEGRLFIQTLSSRDKLKLDDGALLQAVQGADVFVDPIIRYIEGEENNASDQRILSNKLLALISAEARSVWCAHHSPKAFKDVTDITTQNVLRGTGEFAAFPDLIFGVLKTNDEASRLYIKCTDARDDDEYLGDFEVEMRPWIDETGDLKLVVPPGTGTPLREQRRSKSGPKVDPDKQAKIDFVRERINSGCSLKKATEEANEKFGSKHGVSTFSEWLKTAKPFDSDQGEEANVQI